MQFVEVFTGLFEDELMEASLFLMRKKVALCSLVLDDRREYHAYLPLYLNYSLLEMYSFEEDFAVEHP